MVSHSSSLCGGDVRFGGGEDFQHKHGISESSAALR
jgi:hypothetical protein